MDNNLNLLVYSKEEYTNQFIMYIKDHIFDGFKSIYGEVKKYIQKEKF